MNVIEGSQHVSSKPCAVTIGNFDGVHLGHQKLIEQCVSIARNNHWKAFLYTFWPHPKRYFNPGSPPPLLLTRAERCALIESFGIDEMVEELFNEDFSQISDDEFFERILMDRLNAKHVVVGYDFRFGKGRHGKVDKLKSLGYKHHVDVKVVDPIQWDEMTVSSSRIREALSKGDISLANQWLGYPFFYEGEVLQGDQRGQKIGFPTLNLAIPPEKMTLPFGVYASVTEVVTREGMKAISSVTNIGTRPTFTNQDQVWVETHCLHGFHQNLYGEKVRVFMKSKIRDERQFSDVNALKKQIHSDIEMAKRILP